MRTLVARSLISLGIIATILTAAVGYATPARADVPFAQGIVTFAFDDGYKSFAENAAPVLNTADLDATIYVYSSVVDGGDFMTEEQLAAMAAAGHDVGGHSVTHPDLTAVTAEQLASEITDNRTYLQGLSLGPVSSFAYPYGAFNGTVSAAVEAGGYTAARTVVEGFNFSDSDLLTLKTEYVRQTEDPAASVISKIDQAMTDKTWLIITFHEIADEVPAGCVSAQDGDSEECVSTAYLQTLVDYVKNNDLCVQTVHEVITEVPCPTTGEVDTTPATLSIAYSTTASTTGPVTATASANEAGEFTNEGGATHVFTVNGTFDFVFSDLAGNISTSTAIVSNIGTSTGGGGGGGGGSTNPNAPTCPTNFTLTNGDCVYSGTPVAPTCPEGYTQVGDQCETTAEPIEPNVCPEGFTLTEEGCVTAPVAPTCPEGLRFQEDMDGNDDGCVSEVPTAPDACVDGNGDPTGAVFSQGQCVVIMGEPIDGACTLIPTTIIRVIDGEEKCVVVPPSPAEEPACAEGLVMNGGQCYEIGELSCPTGTEYDDASNMCVMEDPIDPTCPAGTEEDGNECEYVTIDANVCPAGYTLGTGGCVGTTVEPTCPAGMQLNGAGTLCETIPTSGGGGNPGGSSGGGGGGGGTPAPVTPGNVLGAATSSCYQFTRNLSRGMSGSDVMELQKVLKVKNLLTIDAPTMLFGPMTSAAVVKFQAANGLEQVGNVGPKTRALLNVCGTNPNQALIDELTKKLNSLLEQIKQLVAQGQN